MDTGDSSEFLTVRETARLLNVHENTVRNWVRAGALRSSRIAGARAHRFTRAEVERVLQDAGNSIAPPAALQTREHELVGPIDLDRWASRLDAKAAFPDLMGRLLAETGGVSNLHVRAHEGVAAHGWDGSAHVAGSAFLPDGDLVFELGTDEDPERKAQREFSKRSHEAGAASHVFVFCSPRNWPGGRRWAQQRREERVFAGVEVFDAHRLAAWLRGAPGVHQWISERLGYAPREAQTLDGWWSDTQQGWRLAVPAGFFAAGRDVEVTAVRQRLQADDEAQRVLTLQASSRVEALAFLVAAAEEAAGSVLVVHSAAGWDRLVAAQLPLVLVPLYENPQVGRAVAAGHRVVLLAGDAERVEGDTIVLPRVDPLASGQRLDPVLDKPLERPRLTGLARRNMPAFLRWLNLDRRHRTPAWAIDPQSGPLLARLLLASSWTTGEGDLNAVDRLTGEPWRASESILQSVLAQGDPVFRRTAEAWRVTAPVEAASFLLRWLTDDDVEQWRVVAVAALTEPDPLHDMEGGVRLRAQLDGVGRRYSGELRRGLVLAMALVAATAVDADARESVRMAPLLIAREVWAMARADRSGATWRRLSEVMPLLAEAAPEAFLDAVEEDLSGPSPLLRSMFDDAATSDFGFGTSSAHTGLLWALESLCWSDEFLVRAVSALAGLARIDPGGRLMNRPIASLSGALLGWIRHSAASAGQKIELAEMVLAADAAVGWRLVAGLLPKHHATAFTPSTPTYADWLPNSEQVSWNEWTVFETGIVSLALGAAGADAARWKALVDAYPRVAEPRRAQIVAALQGTVASGRVSIEDRFSLWHHLDELIKRHEEYPDSDWALEPAALEDLRRLRTDLEVRTDPRTHLGLFGWHRTFAGLRYDEPGFHEAVRDAQLVALTDLLERGPAALEQLLMVVPSATAVGWTLAQLPAAEQLDDTAVRWVETGVPQLMQTGTAFLRRRADAGGTTWVSRLGETLAAASKQTRSIVAAELPLSREMWTFLEAQLPDLVEAYWARVEPMLDDWSEYREATRQLLARDHSWSAITLLSHYLQEDRRPNAELVFEALTRAAASLEPVRNRTMISYHVEQLLLLLEGEQPEDERLAALELLYFDLLHDHEPATALFRQLNASPTMFLQFITSLFRGDDEEPRDRSPEEKAFANRAFSVLHAWRTVPGEDPDGSVDRTKLETWVRAARIGLEDSRRLSIGDEQIGEILSASPVGTDGLWPAEAVREVIESTGSIRLETGLEIGRFNRRGVTMRSPYEGGGPERELEEQYRHAAARLHVRWPRTARALRALADSYGRDARREDERAQLDADRE